MRSINVIIVFITISISQLYCQENCRYSEYDDLILSALENISLKKYHLADGNYRDAFSKVEVPFSADLTSALNVAVIVKDSVRVNEIAVSLAKGGIPLEFFESFHSYAWYSRFKSQYGEYITFHNSNFDLKLKSELLELRKQDSIFNESWHQWKRGEIELSVDDLIVGATGVTEGFKELVNTYGFPSEKRMGYYYKNKEVTSSPVLVVLIHIYQRGVLLYKENLPEFVCQGDLSFAQEMELETFQGFGNSTGIEQEMRLRYEMFRRK